MADETLSDRVTTRRTSPVGDSGVYDVFVDGLLVGAVQNEGDRTWDAYAGQVFITTEVSKQGAVNAVAAAVIPVLEARGIEKVLEKMLCTWACLDMNPCACDRTHEVIEGLAKAGYKIVPISPGNLPDPSPDSAITLVGNGSFMDPITIDAPGPVEIVWLCADCGTECVTEPASDYLTVEAGPFTVGVVWCPVCLDGNPVETARLIDPTGET